MRDDVQTPLTIMMGMVLLVIAMAVVNVASLLLVRAAARAREFSVRYALGATGRQILRQLLAEGMLLGLAGAALGLALAPEALRLLIHWMSGRCADELPFAPTLDWRVLGLSPGGDGGGELAVQSCAGGAVPESAAGGSDEAADGNRRRRSLKFRRTCVALQIGFSLLLIVAAGMFVRTIENLRQRGCGIRDRSSAGV